MEQRQSEKRFRPHFLRAIFAEKKPILKALGADGTARRQLDAPKISPYFLGYLIRSRAGAQALRPGEGGGLTFIFSSVRIDLWVGKSIMASRTILGLSIAVALAAGGGALWVELRQREAIEEAGALVVAAGTVETLSDYDSLSAASDYLQAAIARLENAPTFPGQSELEELTFLRSQLQAVEQKREPEKKAREQFEDATKWAMSAAELVQNPPHPPKVWEEAERQWQQAIAQLEGIPEDTATFSEAQGKLKGYRENLAVVSRYAARSRQAVELNNRGMEQIKSGDYTGAIATFNQAIELNPALVQAYLNRGFAYAATGSHQSALANYNRAIQVDSSSPDAHYFRGEEHLQLGNYQDALTDYNQAIELDPNRANAYLDRGFIYYELDDPKKAADDFTKAAELLEDGDEPATRELALNLARDIRATLEPEPAESEPSAAASPTSEEEMEEDEPEAIIIYREQRVKPIYRSRSRGRRGRR